MIKVSANMFKAAALCISKEETRYYLGGVYVEPCKAGGITLTATDGHRLLCIHDKDGSAEKAAIVGAPKGALASKNPDGMVTIDAGGIMRCDTFVSPTSVLVDGIYPDYRAVVRSVKDGWTNKASAAVNGKYLSDFAKIANLISEGASQTLRFMTGEDEGQPLLILFPSSPHAFGLLMPMRGNQPPKNFPWFIAGPVAAAKAKVSEPIKKAA